MIAVCALLFRVRPYDPNILTGYPDGDQSLVSLFTRHAKYNDDIIPKKVCVAIFTAIFNAVSEELRRHKITSPLEWYEQLKKTSTAGPENVSIREEIYEAASKNWQEVYDKVGSVV
jgi:hypothetical protein